MPAENREVRKASNRRAKETEDSYYFDDLAKGLANGTISRRQALKWAGAGIVGTVLASTGFPEKAEALTRRERRRCREKGGVPLEEGKCNCAFQCETGVHLDDFNCQSDPECYCFETTAGRGFCGYAGSDPKCADFEPCRTTDDCSASNAKCIKTTCCDQGICVRPCSSGSTTQFGAASTENTGAVGTRS